MKKKALAIVLALCMVIAMLPATAFAAPAGELRSGMMVPGTVGELEPAAIEPNAKSYTVTLTSEGNGEAELLVDSPAEAGSKVYFTANPDDGYLAEIYYEGLDEDALVYVGADVVGFIMPANKVTLEVVFVRAEGDSHRINVFEAGNGDYALSRTSAKQYESVLLAVQPSDNSAFDPENYVWVIGAMAFYLFEEEGIHYYEIIMGSNNVTIYLSYKRSGPYDITFWYDCYPVGGTATAEPQEAYNNDLVTVTITPDPGFRLVSARAVSDAGSFITELTPIGNNKYTFVMHPTSVEIHVVFEPIINPVSVVVDTGLGGTASVDVSEAQQGDTVTLTCAPEEGYRIAQITGVSGLVDNGDNTYSFTMPGQAVELHVLFLRHENPFLDVNETRYFYDPVLWAVENGITKGMDATHFVPDGTCTRAQAVTFLWRAAGSPEPEATESDFTDVKEGSFYYKAVLWAVENGITKGMTDTTFGPDELCTRAQVVTFLWRVHGSPEPETTVNPFVDVSERGFYYKAVLWAVENGITKGMDATHFNPDGTCTRAQTVTFLYRAAQLPVAYELHWVINGFQDTPSDYGTVTLSHTSAVAGETITATVVPAEGYVIDWVKCEFGTAVTQVSETEYTFVMPEHAETFHVNFVEEVAEPEPSEPDPEVPAETYTLTLKDNGFGTVSYVDKMEAAAGESIFFYAVPNEGYYLEKVEIFNPNNEIDVSTILVYDLGENLYELVMIEHELIMTCVFSPIPNT